MTGFKKGLYKVSQTLATVQMPSALAIQSYMPIVGRRDLEEEEQREVDEYSRRLIPKIWRSDQTPLTQLMYSPKKRSIATIILGASGGTALGSLGTEKGKIGRGAKGAIIGSALSLPVAVFEYFRHRRINENTLEALRRLPVNATIRDMKADPVYQKDQDRMREDLRHAELLRRKKYGV